MPAHISSRHAMPWANETWLNNFPSIPVALDGPVSRRANSQIFHAVFDSPTPHEAAFKHCINPKDEQPDEGAATAQFAALTRVSQAFKEGPTRFRVPTPYDIAPQLGIFSMSWVNGASLSHKLCHTGALIHATDWMNDVGAWLGYFHQKGPLQIQRLHMDPRRLKVARINELVLVDNRFSRIAQLLKTTAHALENEQVAVTWLHGDCKADNFILSDRDIYGIDISLCHENPVEYDLAMFFNNLDLVLCNLRLLPLWPLKTRLAHAFWAGYRSTGPAVSQHYLTWVRLNFLLSPWQALSHTSQPDASHWVLKKVHSKMATNLATQLLINHATTAKP